MVRKQNFPKKQYFLLPDTRIYMCVSEGKCYFLETFDYVLNEWLQREIKLLELIRDTQRESIEINGNIDTEWVYTIVIHRNKRYVWLKSVSKEWWRFYWNLRLRRIQNPSKHLTWSVWQKYLMAKSLSLFSQNSPSSIFNTRFWIRLCLT